MKSRGRWGWFVRLDYWKAHFWIGRRSLCGRAKAGRNAGWFDNAVRRDGTGTKRTEGYGDEWFCIPCANAIDRKAA